MTGGLLNRGVRKLKSLFMRSRLEAYLGGMSAENPLRGLPTRIVGDASADPTEFFTHYEAFGYWVAERLARTGRRQRILDIGSPKAQNAILSASHEVTSTVLSDCFDRISAVNYVRHDVTLPLPFPAASFDYFTSTVTLTLVGLGRYGDRVDANALPNLVTELGRVVSADGELLVSLAVGPNMLSYNNHWCLDLDTIQRVFGGWRLADTLVDTWSSPKGGRGGDPTSRFVGADLLPAMEPGDYRVVFCRFVRDRSPALSASRT